MRALVLVDIQNDFMPGGSLAVRDGDAVVPVANRLAADIGFVVATQDWHPRGHSSFASSHAAGALGDVEGVVLWPDHCVQNTAGASFHSGLDVWRLDAVVRKGDDPEIDSYSGFFDNDGVKETGLRQFLQSRDIGQIVLVGVATDYCVKFTALDGVRLGFGVTVVVDGVRAVDLRPGDGVGALEEMHAAGCALASSADV